MVVAAVILDDASHRWVGRLQKLTALRRRRLFDEIHYPRRCICSRRSQRGRDRPPVLQAALLASRLHGAGLRSKPGLGAGRWQPPAGAGHPCRGPSSGRCAGALPFRRPPSLAKVHRDRWCAEGAYTNYPGMVLSDTHRATAPPHTCRPCARMAPARRSRLRPWLTPGGCASGLRAGDAGAVAKKRPTPRIKDLQRLAQDEHSPTANGTAWRSGAFLCRAAHGTHGLHANRGRVFRVFYGLPAPDR